MANKKETNKSKRGKYDEKVVVNATFIELIDAAILDAESGNFKKRVAKSKKAKK